LAADRNICHFVWYGGLAGEGLRSDGADDLPPSKSGCSILPIARRLLGRGPTGLRPFALGRVTGRLPGASIQVKRRSGSITAYGPSHVFSLAALVLPIVSGAAFARSPSSVARDPGRCDHTYPRWGGHTLDDILQTAPCSAHRLLSQGRSPHATPTTTLRGSGPSLWRSPPSLCPKPSSVPTLAAGA